MSPACLKMTKKSGLYRVCAGEETSGGKDGDFISPGTAAVMFLVVTAAGLIPQQTNSRVEPMTNVLTDDTIRSVSKTQLSDDITVQICTDCSYLPLKASGSDSVSDRQIQFSYTYPKIYYQGTEVESVTRYYEDRIEQLKTQAQTQFKNVAFVKDLDIPVKISYHCSALNDVTAPENNLVSIYENYSESYTAYDKDGAYVTVMTNAVYGGNFNAKTGKKLSLNELFEENDLSGLEKNGSVSDRQNRNYRRLQIRMHGIYRRTDWHCVSTAVKTIMRITQESCGITMFHANKCRGL